MAENIRLIKRKLYSCYFVVKEVEVNRLQVLRPPLPPKGEQSSAPVPPPRRHRRAGSTGPSPCPSPTPTRHNQVHILHKTF